MTSISAATLFNRIKSSGKNDELKKEIDKKGNSDGKFTKQDVDAFISSQNSPRIITIDGQKYRVHKDGIKKMVNEKVSSAVPKDENKEPLKKWEEKLVRLFKLIFGVQTLPGYIDGDEDGLIEGLKKLRDKDGKICWNKGNSVGNYLFGSEAQKLLASLIIGKSERHGWVSDSCLDFLGNRDGKLDDNDRVTFEELYDNLQAFLPQIMALRKSGVNIAGALLSGEITYIDYGKMTEYAKGKIDFNQIKDDSIIKNAITGYVYGMALQHSSVKGEIEAKAKELQEEIANTVGDPPDYNELDKKIQELALLVAQGRIRTYYFKKGKGEDFEIDFNTKGLDKKEADERNELFRKYTVGIVGRFLMSGTDKLPAEVTKETIEQVYKEQIAQISKKPSDNTSEKQRSVPKK